MTDEQRYAASQSYEDGENVGDAADHVQGIGSAAGRISPGHEQIAQHISSAREAVARMLKSFSEDGLVELKRGAITLRDTGGLNHLK
ncbi:MAG: hypothetical protein BHV90_05115 [Clostridiales bacterium 42_27]|nr:MAG: hypothetical protein BHV90_05115 [Clostridiales bacterium 42_27]